MPALPRRLPPNTATTLSNVLAIYKALKACKIVYICQKIYLSKFNFFTVCRFSRSGASQLQKATRCAGLLLLAGLTVPALAQNNSQPAQDTSKPNPAAPSNPAPANPKPMNASPKEAGAPVDSGKYKIGPNDILFIRVWGESEFSGPVAVHQDGKFTMPLVGDLPAGGKTPLEVQNIVAEALKKLVVRPLVTVTVQEVGSKRYYLDGQAMHPGEYALVTPTTVLEAISRAGGLAEFANGKKIYILRGDQQIKFNYKDVLKGKNMSQNIKLENGDHIVVP